MVVLTLLITSSVSFTYSSSDVASAGVTGTSHNALEITMEAVDRNSRRRWCAVVVGVRVAAMVVGLGLVLGGSDDLGVDVGVMSVGEAMV